MNRRRNVYHRKDTMAEIPPKILDSIIYNPDFDLKKYEEKFKEEIKWLDSPAGKSWFYKFFYGLEWDIVKNIIKGEPL